MAKEKIILTGDRPTGRLHIGHYVGSLRRRVELQNSGLYDKIFIFIADAQALTDNMENPEKVRQNVQFDAPTEQITSPIPVLYQSGYLTIKGYDRNFQIYRLAYPNGEVRKGFIESLLPSYVHLPTGIQR